MKITGTGNRATLTANGRRCGVHIFSGPWAAGVDPLTVKVRPKKNRFPDQMRGAFVVENNSDSQVDYFESDCLRLLPGHPLYAQALAAVGKEAVA